MFKGPILRGLAARAPYFQNGSADSLDQVVGFYNQRFQMGLTANEMADLVVFLASLLRAMVNAVVRGLSHARPPSPAGTRGGGRRRNVRGAQLVRRTVEVTSEISDRTQVTAYGTRRVIATLEFLQHHLA
jgi:hypothetical protein